MENEMGGRCSMYGGGENCIQDSDKKLEGNRLLGRPRLRWEDNIKIHLKGIGWNGVEWIDVS
jgi:hypothetical protein